MFSNNISKVVWGSLMVAIYLVHIPAKAADYSIDDNYLQSLAEEADHLEYMGKAEKELRTSQKADVATSSAVVEHTRVATSGKRGFESVLSNEYPYTYQLYKKLASNEKQQVFDKIRESKKWPDAQKMIIDLYKSSIKQ